MLFFPMSRKKSVISNDARGVVRGLRERGVRVMRGAVFAAIDPAVGQPPEGAMDSQFAMHRDAQPLSEAEQSLAEMIIREEVAEVTRRVVAEADTTVSMAVANFVVQPGRGIDLVVELHGLVDRVVRLSLN
jgi:hypothetical protein